MTLRVSEVETVDMTPSKESYKYMLQLIVDNSSISKDIEWAKQELNKL